MPHLVRSLISIPASLSPYLSLTRAQRTLLISFTAILAGSVLTTFAVRSLPEKDHIYVGNTAGTLTSMVEVSGYRVLIGAGPSRSHAADFIGRSTRPWSRDIDLLLIPGWDDTHAVGALGLLERRSVDGVAVVGVPGDQPIWTLLERQAQADDVPLRFVSTPHQVSLTLT